MTFILAFATRDFALIAGDMRVWRYDAETDTGSMLPELQSKIRHLCGGWLGLSGTCAIAEIVAHHMDKASNPVQALRSARLPIETALGRFRPAYAAAARRASRLLFVHDDGNECVVAGLNWESGTVAMLPGVSAVPPPELDPDECRALLEQYESELCEPGANILRSTAALFTAVRDRCPDTVSDLFEVAMVKRAQRRVAAWRLRPLSAKAAMSASPELMHPGYKESIS